MTLLGRFRSQRRAREAAHALYTAIVARARASELYAELGVPDTLDGRFDMLVLHMFLVLERLRAGGERGRRLSQALFDLMFRDLDRSLRELGVGDHAIGGRIKQMISAFYGRMQAYDDAAADAARLAEALRRNVYREQPVEAAALSGLAEHVLATRRQLSQSPLEGMLEGTLDFAAAGGEQTLESR